MRASPKSRASSDGRVNAIISAGVRVGVRVRVSCGRRNDSRIPVHDGGRAVVVVAVVVAVVVVVAVAVAAAVVVVPPGSSNRDLWR